MSGRNKPDFNNLLAVGQDLDLKLPDSRAVRDAYAQAETESQPWLFNHVVRSWLYGAKLAQHRGLTPDAELVAVSVLLHDLGLARGWRSRPSLRSCRSGRRPRLRSFAQYGGAPCRDRLGFDRAPHHRIDRAATRAPTWPAARTASRATTADSVIVS